MKGEIPGSCASCGVHECQLNQQDAFTCVSLEREAWLLDERSDEFDAYLTARAAVRPRIFLPWRERLLPLPRYQWRLPDSSQITDAPQLVLRRALAMRRLALQGARRQQVLETFDRRLAQAYSSRLPYIINRLVIAQNFLPFLYLDKTLGGRQYDVLLGRAPRHILQATLDLAQGHYAESKTLCDFRSSPSLVEAERLALEGATRIITPHHQLASLYPGKTTLLPWAWPPLENHPAPGRSLAFLGPTIGRRGAYLVRGAMKRLGLPLVVLGRNLEGENFWNGLAVQERSFGPGWLDGVGLLLAPALTEFKPKRLMEALVRGVTVLATAACGLPPHPKLHLVDPYDEEGFARKIVELATPPVRA